MKGWMNGLLFEITFHWIFPLAELVLGEIIFLARQIGERHKEMKDGLWHKVCSWIILGDFPYE